MSTVLASMTRREDPEVIPFQLTHQGRSALSKAILHSKQVRVIVLNQHTQRTITYIFYILRLSVKYITLAIVFRFYFHLTHDIPVKRISRHFYM